MLKQSLFSPTQPRCAKTHLSPSSVLVSFRPSTLSRSFSEVRNAEGAFPFAKTHCKGERPTRSAVYTSSALRSLRPCLGQGASQGEESVLADSGRADEITDRVGRVRSLACLSILRECAPAVPHVGTIEVLLWRNGVSAVCEAGNCCYRSFASVASNVFILLRMFSRPASPGHHTGRSDRLLGRVNEV
jgi:hypothetical protein